MFAENSADYVVVTKSTETVPVFARYRTPPGAEEQTDPPVPRWEDCCGICAKGGRPAVFVSEHVRYWADGAIEIEVGKGVWRKVP